MKQIEKDEIKKLPSKYRPIGAWGYFGYNILFAIPLVGFICLVIFACSGSNINRRSYARSFFCAIIIALIVGIVLVILALTVFKDVLGPYLEQLMQLVQGGGGEQG